MYISCHLLFASNYHVINLLALPVQLLFVHYSIIIHHMLNTFQSQMPIFGQKYKFDPTKMQNSSQKFIAQTRLRVSYQHIFCQFFNYSAFFYLTPFSCNCIFSRYTMILAIWKCAKNLRISCVLSLLYLWHYCRNIEAILTIAAESLPLLRLY